MGQIGDELRLYRESKGISLREVEEATKIRMKYLIALEADDYDALPGKVYVIGFLRTYARFLGMNAEELVNSLKSQSSFEVQEEETKEKVKPTRKRSHPTALILIIVLALVIGGISFALLHDWDMNTPNENVPQTETPQEEPDTPGNIPDTSEPENQNDGNSESEINGVSVTVIIKESKCWIGVNIDGVSDFEGTLYAGENRTFSGQEKISIKYGNARVVEVIANGESTYPVDNTGQVVTKEYTANE
ncbi:MAG: RodZ domain-containing protein [Dehalobacterium sp.]